MQRMQDYSRGLNQQPHLWANWRQVAVDRVTTWSITGIHKLLCFSRVHSYRSTLICSVLFFINSRPWRICTSNQQTELNSPFQWNKKPNVATLSIYIYSEQLDQEFSITFEIYSDCACLKMSRETLKTIDSFFEQSRSIQSICSM